MKNLSLIVAKHIYIHPERDGFQGYKSAGKELQQIFDKEKNNYRKELLNKLNKFGTITVDDINNIFGIEAEE